MLARAGHTPPRLALRLGDRNRPPPPRRRPLRAPAPPQPLPPLRALNLAAVRILGTNLLTVRIDLHTASHRTRHPSTAQTRAQQLADLPCGTSRWGERAVPR